MGNSKRASIENALNYSYDRINELTVLIETKSMSLSLFADNDPQKQFIKEEIGIYEAQKIDLKAQIRDYMSQLLELDRLEQNRGPEKD